jgi:hypothetical protein
MTDTTPVPDPDDCPCIRCGKDALDTGWECTECGMDCRDFYYPQHQLMRDLKEQPK